MKDSIGKKANSKANFSSHEDDLDQYFEFFFGAHRPPIMHAEKGWHPAADLYETSKFIYINVEIAGIVLENVSLILDKKQLILEGVRQENIEQKKRQYHKMEIQYGPFKRVFNLPSNVCADEVIAEYHEGFLKIELKKQEKKLTKKRVIKIQ